MKDAAASTHRRGRSARAASRWAGATVLLLSLIGGRCAAAPVTLAVCLQHALERAPLVHAAGAGVDAAEEHVRAARGAYVPHLAAQAEYGVSGGYDETVTNGGITRAGVVLEAPLIDGGLRDAQLAAARARLRSASARVQQQRADVTLAVRSAYFNALAARTEVDAEEEAAHVLGDAIALLERQETQGLGLRADVGRVEVAAENARSATRNARAALETTLAELSTLTGMSIEAAELTEADAISLVPVSGSQIEASPLMADARAAVEAAQRDRDAVRTEWRGHLLLTADGGFLGVRPDSTFRENGGGEFFLRYVMPIFDGGATRARIAAATATAASVVAERDQTRQTIDVALQRTRLEAERAQADVDTWRRAVPQAAEAFQLMRARYFGGGDVRVLEVIDALSQWVNAQVMLARAIRSHRVAVATQDQILGTVPS